MEPEHASQLLSAKCPFKVVLLTEVLPRLRIVQRPYTSTLKFPGLAVGNGRGCFSVGGAGGLKSDVLRKTRCVFVSTWQVLAPYSVFTVSTSLSLSGESS